MTTVYVLNFHNDGGTVDDYGVYATRNAAKAVIRKTQEEMGMDGFEDELWDIDEQEVK